MAVFSYSPPILTDFPTIRGGVVRLDGLANTPTPAALLDAYREQQRLELEALASIALSEIPSVAAWRRAFSSFGVKPTQYRNAAEALLRRLTKQGEIPSVNLAVDMANLVSIRHRLPVAVFDQRAVTGATTVRYADGAERFTDLGSETVTHPEPGEVIFVDDSGLVSARRWCWRQSDQSATRLETSSVLFTVEGQHDTAEPEVTLATADLCELIAEYQPTAEVRSAILSPERPEFS